MVTVTVALKGFTATVTAAGVHMSRQPPRLRISQWTEQDRKEKLWVEEDWSCVSTVHPRSSSQQQREASERAHQEPADKGMQGRGMSSRADVRWRIEAQGHWLCLGRVQKV